MSRNLVIVLALFAMCAVVFSAEAEADVEEQPEQKSETASDKLQSISNLMNDFRLGEGMVMGDMGVTEGEGYGGLGGLSGGLGGFGSLGGFGGGLGWHRRIWRDMEGMAAIWHGGDMGRNMEAMDMVGMGEAMGAMLSGNGYGGGYGMSYGGYHG
ncbi:hypothetical protein Ocin01_19181 [Orchesella cincta]|uniref:Uncharacterized protein n=1 Tax=Orchesella cincta TaxID=48709 RepID=A0A1D2M3J0_ORCCI|nr:hypothetical protein Ocin01_19181 [Orchesella cincta]